MTPTCTEPADEPKKDRLVFDDAMPGLALRIAAGGAKSFLAQYTIAGRKRRVPIGRWGAIRLKQARTAAKSIFGDVARGQDVAHVRTTERKRVKAEAAASKVTLSTLLTQWDRLALAQHRNSYRAEAVRAIKAAFPGYLERRADALTRADAVEALDKLLKAGKATMAGRTLAYSRAAFTWAHKRGLVADNPFMGIPVGSDTVSRDRVLTVDELGVIWQAAGKLGWPFKPIMRLLILTAQRRDEVAGMRWSELSADRTTWTIPAERSKNRKAHIVHLAPAAQAILAELPRMSRSDLVFTLTGTTPVSGFSHAKARLDRLVAELQAGEAGQDPPEPLAGWRVHDFRRSSVTWMAEHGIAPHVADRILNHVRGTISGVAAVYQRGEFLAERKAALESWAGVVSRVSGRG